LGYFVWYDYGVVATKRNLPGMKEGVTKSECLLIFLSGRKEVVQDGEGVADPAGKYEGTFTRWFCHEEMRTAHEQELRFVGVMETELRHGKPDFALEESQALTGGSDGGPVNTNAPDHVYLLSGLCFIPFRRQEHEVVAMLKEIERQAALPSGGLGLEPEPEPEPEEFGDFDCFPGDDLTDFGDFGGGADPFDSDPFADFHPFDESTPAPAPAVAELASTADGFFEEDPFRAAPAPARSVAAPAAVATAPTGRGMFDFGAPVAASPPPQQQAAMEPHHAMMQPQQGMTQPHHGMMQPHHGIMQLQGMMQLQHAMMQPQHAMQPQQAMMMQPQQAMMQPKPGTMQPWKTRAGPIGRIIVHWLGLYARRWLE
jgi:hypothetical protein